MYLVPLQAAAAEVSAVWYAPEETSSFVHQGAYAAPQPQYALSVPWFPQKQHTVGSAEVLFDASA
jgi:hypothetical protein